MKKKNLLLVGWFFYPKVGGVESLMLSQALYFVKKGYEVSVLTSKDINSPEEEKLHGINIYRREYINSEIDYSKRIAEELPELIQKIKPDIVHFHNGSYPSASRDFTLGVKNIITIFNILKTNNTKIIEHAHNAQLKEPEKTAPLRELDWDLIIFVSNYAKSKWQEVGFKAKSAVIYNGIDYETFSKAKPNKLRKRFLNKKIIFFPSRIVSMTKGIINPQKNFHKVLTTCSILKKYFDKFILVAIENRSLDNKNNNNAYIQLDSLIKKLSLEENIYLIKEVTLNEMPGYYASSDVVFVPSIRETFGLVYLEAMAAGKIVIASNTGGPSEYIKNKVNGFLVDHENDGEMAKILDDVLTNDMLYEQISLNAKKTAQNFTIEKMMQNIEIIYGKTI